MRSRTLLAVAAALMALSLGLTACGGDDDEGGGDGGEPAGGGISEELQVGILIPQTGDLSQFAPAGEKAAEMAVEELNAAFEEAGSEATVSSSVADDETRPQAGQQAARSLIDGGASCIAGSWASGVTIPTAQAVAVRQQVPMISPASTSPEITDLPDDGFLFRTAPSDALQGQVLADAVGEQFGTDATISAAARNDPYGEGIINQFAESFEEAGGTVNGPVLYDPEGSTYNSEANQITSGEPDGYVIIDFEEPYNRVGAALVRTGNFDSSNLFTADGLAFDEIPDTIPADSLDNANGTRPASPEDTETAQAFNDAYRQSDLSPRQRGTFDGQNFDAVMLCALAAVAAGSTEGSAIAEQIQNVASAPGEQYDFTQLADAITALENGEEIDFEGVSGPLDLDDNGDPTVAFYETWHYEDGKLTVDETVEREAEE